MNWGRRHRGCQVSTWGGVHEGISSGFEQEETSSCRPNTMELFLSGPYPPYPHTFGMTECVVYVPARRNLPKHCRVEGVGQASRRTNTSFRDGPSGMSGHEEVHSTKPSPWRRLVPARSSMDRQVSEAALEASKK